MKRSMCFRRHSRGQYSEPTYLPVLSIAGKCRVLEKFHIIVILIQGQFQLMQTKENGGGVT